MTYRYFLRGPPNLVSIPNVTATWFKPQGEPAIDVVLYTDPHWHRENHFVDAGTGRRVKSHPLNAHTVSSVGSLSGIAPARRGLFVAYADVSIGIFGQRHGRGIRLLAEPFTNLFRHLPQRVGQFILATSVQLVSLSFQLPADL